MSAAEIASFTPASGERITPVSPVLYRFTLRRDPRGDYTGELSDPDGWVITIRAAVATDTEGRKGFSGYGWVTAGPPEAGEIDPREPSVASPDECLRDR